MAWRLDRSGALAEVVVEVAEHARLLAEFSQHGRLKEQPGKQPPVLGRVANLQADHEAIIRALRADLTTMRDKFADAGTTDLLSGLLEERGKTAWMLRALLEAKP